MAGNTIGSVFRVTTWGESHGKALGAVVDGCPPGMDLDESDIQQALNRRKPSTTVSSTTRRESDKVEILSGIFEGKTTGTPISLSIKNVDAKSSSYDELKDIFRPGQGDFTYLQKYGIRDWRGGGAFVRQGNHRARCCGRNCRKDNCAGRHGCHCLHAGNRRNCDRPQ